jgi:hypothetical protein
MLASELINKLIELIAKHDDRPLFLSEEGNDYSPSNIEVITQQPLPPNCQGVVEVGDTYFYIS